MVAQLSAFPLIGPKHHDVILLIVRQLSIPVSKAARVIMSDPGTSTYINTSIKVTNTTVLLFAMVERSMHGTRDDDVTYK